MNKRQVIGISVICIILSVGIVYSVNAWLNPDGTEEISWDNTKSVGTYVIVSAPQEFTNCILSPDNGDGWDKCVAYVEVQNNLADFTRNKINFNSIWKSGNTRNISYQYTKTIQTSETINPYFNNASGLWENTSSYTHKYIGFTSTLPNVLVGETIVIRIYFEKPTWTTASFDFSQKFGNYEQILDPDVSVCGTLSVDGATYTLNQSVTSTGTCFTIGANNITLTSNSSLNQINFSTTTIGRGVYNNEYMNVTIKNLNITTINTSASTYNIYYTGVNAKFGNITNNTITATTGSGIYLLGSSNNNLSYNNATATIGYGINLASYSNNNNFSYNNVSATSGYGIYLVSSSNNNNLSYNNVSATSGYGIYLASSSNNTLKNNNATATSGIGIIVFSSSNNNNISGGSISSNSGSSYYLASSSNNTFTNTNFTTRKIQHAVTLSWFNYSNGTGLPFVANNISAAKIMSRTLYNWTQSNITWSDNVTATTGTSWYNVTDLSPSTLYNVTVDGVGVKNETTDANGKMGIFSVALTTTAKTIKIISLSTAPASYSSRSNQIINTSNTVAVTKYVDPLSYRRNISQSITTTATVLVTKPVAAVHYARNVSQAVVIGATVKITKYVSPVLKYANQTQSFVITNTMRFVKTVATVLKYINTTQSITLTALVGVSKYVAPIKYYRNISQSMTIVNTVITSKYVAPIYYNRSVLQSFTIGNNVLISKYVALILSNFTKNVSQVITIGNSVSINKSKAVLNNLYIDGYVNNTVGEYLMGAKVTINGTTIVTDSNGHYNFTGLYNVYQTITITDTGYQNINSGIDLLSNTTLNFTMELVEGTTGGLEEGVVSDDVIIVGLLVGVSVWVIHKKRKSKAKTYIYKEDK